MAHGLNLRTAHVGYVHGAQLVVNAVGGRVVVGDDDGLGVGILRLQIHGQQVAGIGAAEVAGLFTEGRRGVVVPTGRIVLVGRKHVVRREGVGGHGGGQELGHGAIHEGAVVLEGVVHHHVLGGGNRILGRAHVHLAGAGEPLARIQHGVVEAAVGMLGLEGDLERGEQRLGVHLVHFILVVGVGRRTGVRKARDGVGGLGGPIGAEGQGIAGVLLNLGHLAVGILQEDVVLNG